MLANHGFIQSENLMFGCIFEHFRNFNLFPSSNDCGLLNKFVKTIVNIFICLFLFYFDTKSEFHEYMHNVFFVANEQTHFNTF